MAESKILIKRLHGRGVTGMVEIHGQALFAPHADVSRWQRRLTGRVLGLAGAYAPSNKRPRWAHSGKRLKTSMKASTPKPRISAGGGSVRSAVGSTSPHAMFVDQGTGIHGMGNGPYQAKILPPWTRGSPSLFESTWRPGPGQPAVGTTTVTGQRPQYFMDRALTEGLRRSGMKTVNVPDSAISAAKAKDFYTTVFDGAAQFAGSAAFDAELTQWREWRDAAWNKKHSLGEGAALTRHITRRLEDDKRHKANVAIRKEIRKTFSADARRKKRKAREARNAKNLKTVVASKPTKTPKKPKPRQEIPLAVKSQMTATVNAWLRNTSGRYTFTGKFSSTHFTVRDRNGNSRQVQWPVGISSRLRDLLGWD